MIAVLGISLAVVAAIACAAYFVLRSSPASPARRPTPANKKKKPALPGDPPAEEGDPSVAETDHKAADTAASEPTTSGQPAIRPVEPPRAGNGPFADTRRHPRTVFPGTAPATIYPPDSRQKSDPVQCIVDTRDLSCNGIGIGHNQQLYPSQMIVIQAFGKLLVGEIRWCHRVDNHYYVAGCRLVKSVS